MVAHVGTAVALVIKVYILIDPPEIATTAAVSYGELTCPMLESAQRTVVTQLIRRRLETEYTRQQYARINTFRQYVQR